MWIICTTTSPDGEFLYGMTYLHNDFFVISLKTDEIVFFWTRFMVLYEEIVAVVTH